MQKHAASSEIISTDTEAMITNAADSKFCDTFIFIFHENNENKRFAILCESSDGQVPCRPCFFEESNMFLLLLSKVI